MRACRTLLAVVAMATLAGASPPDHPATSAATAPGQEKVAQPGQSAQPAPKAPAPAKAPPRPTEPERRPEPKAPKAEGARLAELIASEEYLVLDVRRPDEIEEHGTIEGYLNIPIDELADRLGEVPRDRPVLTA